MKNTELITMSFVWIMGVSSILTINEENYKRRELYSNMVKYSSIGFITGCMLQICDI